tara:strand:- start:341 stop:451 length:111 start_codon:yes stop_codon:yes gene_type:complete
MDLKDAQGDDREKQLKNAFNLFDKNKDGTVTSRDFV